MAKGLTACEHGPPQLSASWPRGGVSYFLPSWTWAGLWLTRINRMQWHEVLGILSSGLRDLLTSFSLGIQPPSKEYQVILLERCHLEEKSQQQVLQQAVTQSLSRVRLWNPTDDSMLGLPVLHCLLEFVQTNSCPLSQWCLPTISSSVTPFSSCPQSFPASGSPPMSQVSGAILYPPVLTEPRWTQMSQLCSDGLLYVSTWVGHRMPRYLVQHYSGCICEVSEWD